MRILSTRGMSLDSMACRRRSDSPVLLPWITIVGDLETDSFYEHSRTRSYQGPVSKTSVVVRHEANAIEMAVTERPKTMFVKRVGKFDPRVLHGQLQLKPTLQTGLHPSSNKFWILNINGHVQLTPEHSPLEVLPWSLNTQHASLREECLTSSGRVRQTAHIHTDKSRPQSA